MVTAAEYSVKIRGEYKFVTILEKKFKRYGFANLNSIDDRILKKMNVGVSGIIQQCGFVAKKRGCKE